MSLSSTSKGDLLRRFGRAVRLQALLFTRAVLQSDFRNNEVTLLAFAVAIGILGAGAVIALSAAVDAFHAAAFDLPYGAHLSDGRTFDAWRVLALPVAGGLL